MPKTAVSNLKCEYQINPLGIDVLQPRLSWQMQSDQRDAQQTAYQILAASSDASLESDQNYLWDSGKIKTDQSTQVNYRGSTLVAIISNSYEELQDFALSIAERILRLSIREQDETIIATIEEALQKSVKSDEFTIHIHPEDYETVLKNSSEIIAGLTGLNNIVIKKDTAVERGGAMIESDNCTIDATIASQFDVIREEVKKNL